MDRTKKAIAAEKKIRKNSKNTHPHTHIYIYFLYRQIVILIRFYISTVCVKCAKITRAL